MASGIRCKSAGVGRALTRNTTGDHEFSITWAAPLDHAAALVAGMVKGPRPPQLQALISSVAAGHALHLYIPNSITRAT